MLKFPGNSRKKAPAKAREYVVAVFTIFLGEKKAESWLFWKGFFCGFVGFF